MWLAQAKDLKEPEFFQQGFNTVKWLVIDEVTPDGYLVHFDLLVGSEPINYSEALNNEHWKEDLFKELQAIERKNTWELFKLPTYTKVIKVKWMLKLKHNPDGLITRHKARLVAQRFLQRVGLD